VPGGRTVVWPCATKTRALELHAGNGEGAPHAAATSAMIGFVTGTAGPQPPEAWPWLARSSSQVEFGCRLTLSPAIVEFAASMRFVPITLTFAPTSPDFTTSPRARRL
jgi:hypothetical protein